MAQGLVKIVGLQISFKNMPNYIVLSCLFMLKEWIKKYRYI